MKRLLALLVIALAHLTTPANAESEYAGIGGIAAISAACNYELNRTTLDTIATLTKIGTEADNIELATAAGTVIKAIGDLTPTQKAIFCINSKVQYSKLFE